MSKIDSYGADSVIQDEDKLIRTDGSSDSGSTKNFTVSSLATYISAEALSHPVIITGLLEAADDSAAETAGVPVGGVYVNSGVLQVRQS